MRPELTMSETSPRKDPTAAEAMFFYAIVKHTKNKADIDWSAVAAEQGFKNAEVAKVLPSSETSLSPSYFRPQADQRLNHQVRFGQVKRKLGINGDSSAPARATPKKASGSTSGTPTKVTKTPAGRAGTKARGKGKVKKEEDNDEREPVTPEKSPKQEYDEAANAQLQAEMDADADPF